MSISTMQFLIACWAARAAWQHDTTEMMIFLSASVVFAVMDLILEDMHRTHTSTTEKRMT